MIKKIYKRIISFVFVSVVLTILSVSVCAVDQKVYDDANLLTDTEYQEINDLAKKTSDKIQMDIVIYTTNDDLNVSAEVDAETFYDTKGFGYGTYRDGVLLYLNMTTRDYWVCTTGNMRKYLDDYNLEQLKDGFVSYLSDGDYYQAFTNFIDDTEYYYSCGIPNTEIIFDPATGENIRNPNYNPITGEMVILFSGIALVITGIAIGIVIYRYKNHFSPSAQVYIDKNNYKFKVKNDVFVREYTTKVKIETSSSGGGGFSGGSSGGSSHGGSGGKF